MGFQRAQRLSIFRKVALSTWSSGGDPSVYGFLEIDVTDLNITASPMPMVIKALASIMEKHKELNSILRLGRLYYRQDINVSVLVNIPGEGRSDLSFANIQNANTLSVTEIENLLSKSTQLIRKKKDPHLGFALAIIHLFPAFVTKWILNSYCFFTHDLGVDLSLLRLPKTPFGSVIVTNIGSLGIKRALVPLVPFTRATMLMSIGEIGKEAKVINDKIEIRNIMNLGITFDHRFFDGSHAAAMIRDFENYFKTDSLNC